jgi:uncharacterized protein
MLASAVHALTAEVRDDAGFFKPDTVARANEVIKEIKQRYKKDLVVETVRQVPEGERQEATSPDPGVKARFFAGLAVRRAREEGVDGIYVLITRQPGHVEVAVGNNTRLVFPDEKRHQLTEILLNDFKKKEYDEGLLGAVQYVRSALAAKPVANRAAVPAGSEHRARPQEPLGARGSAGWSSWQWLGVGLAALLGIWLLLAVVRALAGAGAQRVAGGYAGPGAPAGYGAAGGGSFFPGLLGGLFGAAAGSWLYDRFFNEQSPPVAGAAPPVSAPGSEDTDYTAEGSDFDTTDTSGGDTTDTSGGADGGDFNADDAQGDDTSAGGDFDGGDFGDDDSTGGSF